MHKLTTLSGILVFVLASCGSPENQPQEVKKDTTQKPEQTQNLSVTPQDVLKQYIRSVKRGDSSAVEFATGKAATVKSYDFLKTSSSGFSIAYDEPVINQDSATIGFRVTRESSTSTHSAHLAKVGTDWKVDRIENK